MELVCPSIKHKNSFIQAVKEYHAVDSDDRKDIYELKVEELQNNFPSYISKLLSESQGKNLPEGYVPQTTYWLIDNNEFIGRVSIRHSLTEHLLKEGGHIGYDVRPSKRKMGYGTKILELSLSKAKKLGIHKILVTCNETNIGSKKIIEANGGIFEDHLELDEGKLAKLRYWITV
ncbi:MAG TPA: GNAT family N-acetyltransferase [Methylomirabilota bacterium]|nr:GNAT family N-acetyltransferase [Methylomirabilota bacterium]